MSALTTLTLPKTYGWVILSVLGSIIAPTWMGYEVGEARKRFNVPLPTMYSNDSDEFNCYQRGHQNTLESHYQVMAMSLVGGAFLPIPAAVCTVSWTIGRVIYARGYFTGDPDQRVYGYSLSAPGFAGLFGINAYGAIKMLKNVRVV